MRFSLLALPLAMLAAVPAAALQPITITSAGIYNPGDVAATVNGSTVNEFAVPLTFTADTSKATGFDVLGFCVDLPHQIFVNVGSQLRETLAYHAAPLTADGYGTALSSLQVHEITGLAALGFGIAKAAAADAPAQLAAIQQAIWTVEYPTHTFVATGPYAAAQATYAAAFVKEAPHLNGYARPIIADNGNIQAQITNIGGVPEPASWAMMLAGFGVVGAAARRRRGMMTTVAA